MTAILLVASCGLSVCCLYGCHGDAEALEAICCKTEVSDSQNKHSTQECPNCASEYVNLDVDYLSSSFDFKINIPTVSSAISSFSYVETAIIQKAIQLWELNLPPPPFGKELLPHIQSFLC